MITKSTAETTTSKQLIDYIGDMAQGLAKMARTSGFAALAFILEMASAETIELRMPQSPSADANFSRKGVGGRKRVKSDNHAAATR